jgi:beta-lactamase class A
VLANFEGLPGKQAVKIWAPAANGRPEFLVAQNADQKLFVGSAIKAFVLCERMRQLDGPDILAKITARRPDGTTDPNEFLALNDTVWSEDSATFNPPFLSGQVTERTAMEAMILHSDNTATDMELKQTGPDRVRAFLAEAGLRNSAVPDSTRSFFGYLLGAHDYKNFTWAELVAAQKDNAPIVNSPLNDVETLASSADDLVSFYARSIQGEFFHHPQTLQQYRNVLSLGDVINLVPLPLGTSAFAKGGSIDVPGFHTLCVPGAMYFSGRWVYFAAIINWYAKEETDPAVVSRYTVAARNAFEQVYVGLR